MTGTAWTAEEAVAVFAGRALAAFRTCFVGIGLPSMAAILAQRLYAPQLTLVYESGAQEAHPSTLPLSTGSPAVAQGAAMHGSMLEVFGALQAGRIELGLLSGAQVDRFGNLNSTQVGSGDRAVRLPGSGGALDIALLAQQVFLLMPHDPRRFVAEVDVCTSPGHGLDVAARRRMGLGGGPLALFTDRARFDFEGGELTLAAVVAGFDADHALEGIRWPVPQRPVLAILNRPQAHELELLRSLEART